MREISVREANQNFSRVIADAENGETIIITKHGVPVASIVPQPADRSGERFGDARASVPRLSFAHDPAGIIHAIAPDISATPRENGGLIRRFRNYGGMPSIVSPRGS